jgi:hypothetical protein
MATYTPTITTSAMQEKGIDLEVSRENARRAAAVPPQSALTKPQFLDARLTDFIRFYGDEYKRTVRQMVGDAADTANASQLQNAATAFGIVLP